MRKSILSWTDFNLRPVHPEDSALMFKWRNSERVRRNMYTDHIISVEEHDRWFRNLFQNESCTHLIFEHLSTPLGLVYFTDLDRRSLRCSFGIYLGESLSPMGAGFVMQFLALKYAFECLEIRKLCCEVFSFNNPAVKQCKRFGFQKEGLLKEHAIKGGKYEDIVVLALLRDQWELGKEEIEEKYFKLLKK